MGFLDQLKQRADALKAEQQRNAGASERNAMLADAGCKAALQYWMQLAQQLNVLRPVSRARFAFDARHVVEGVAACEFSVDARRKGLDSHEGYDHVVLQWLVRGGRRLKIDKDFVADIDRLEARLRQAGIQPDTTAQRDPDKGKLLAMQYAFDDTVACAVRVHPDHAQGRLRWQVMNLDGLETLRFSTAAVEVGNGRLDELARWIVGEPHRFLEGVGDLARWAPA